jgi:hypothetical protein
MSKITDDNALDPQQLSRLQRRIRRCSSELSKLSARLASFDASGSPTDRQADQRHIQRNCICLEVALDEASKWANTLLGEMPVEPVDAPSGSAASTALMTINGLLGGMPAVR